MHDTDAFIVRIWRETGDGESEAVWRGSIDHVGRSRRLYFQDLDSIRHFIEEQVGIPPGHRSLPLRVVLRWLGHDS